MQTGNTGNSAAIEQDYPHALALYQQGDLPAAEALCKAILQIQTEHFDALHLSAVIKLARGDANNALGLLQHALSRNQHNETVHFHHGKALRMLQRPAEAISSFRRALAIRPDFPQAMHSLGLCLRALGQRKEALDCFEHTLRLDPTLAGPWITRGGILFDMQQYEESVLSYSQALQLAPDNFDALQNRGVVLGLLKRHQEALDDYQRASAQRPDDADLLYNIGSALQALDQHEAALLHFAGALQKKPVFAKAWYNQGISQHALLRDQDALVSFQRALQIQPDYAAVHWNEALIRLVNGDFAAGWPKYQWRWRAIPGKQLPPYRQPLWLGEQSLQGKTILLWSEQGLGDTIQFCRYARMVAELGARVLLEVHPSLLTLLANLDGVAHIFPQGAGLPDFDFHCPLLSLPLAFRTRIESIPTPATPLRLKPGALAHWQARLGAKTGPRIGLVWSGNPELANDHNRSIALSDLVKLVKLVKLTSDKVSFISLQKQVRPADAAVLDSDDGRQIIHFADALGDFADSAALIHTLDLVISVDTSVAHLATTLGKPVWIILPFDPEWRWMREREDSPWYPTVRLFRQSKAGDWAAVLDQLALAIEQWCSLPPSPDLLSNLLEHALAAHRQGHTGAAARLYRQILGVHATHFDALHLLGVTMLQNGDANSACQMITQALELNPLHVAAHSNLGNALQALGKYQEAINSFNRAIELDPRFVDALYNRGNAFQTLHHHEEAIRSYDQALALQSGHLGALRQRGLAWEALQRHDLALACFDRVLERMPDDIEMWNRRGIALNSLKRHDEALSSFQRALQINPDVVDSWNNYGLALAQREHYQQAIDCHSRALKLQAGNPTTLFNLGNALQGMGQLDAAIAYYQQAIAIRRNQDPLQHNRREHAEVLYNQGNAQQALCRFDAAIASFQQAINYHPDHAQAHINLALCQLITGDYANGWCEYEWRWRSFRYKNPPVFKQPLWLGCEDLKGKTILLHAEQGFGDTIQFVRFARLVKKKEARVLLQVRPPLQSLLHNAPGIDQLFVEGDALPTFDFHCPLLSLPLALSIRLNDIPQQHPAYLQADPALVRQWQARLAAKTKPRIGLVWSGSSGHANDKNRSLGLAGLNRLFDVDANFEFISLQKEVRNFEQTAVKELQDQGTLRHFGAQLHDFSDTAALINAMDLVISVDTSVAHLAGALGKPVWIMLAYCPDWRWLMERADSPWYPSARLFRQQFAGDWDGVVDQVRASLAQIVLDSGNSRV